VAKFEQRETPVMKRIEIGEQGKPLNAVFCKLFMAIGRPQGITFNIAHNSTAVIAFGFPSDIAMAETFYEHISWQMIELGTQFVKAGSWRGETTWCTGTYRWKPVTARVAKRCFYENFIESISWRMVAANRKAEEEVAEEQVITEDGVTSTALVLANKAVEVRDFYTEKSTAKGSWKGNKGNTANSSVGRRAGSQAGQNARLGGEKSIGGGRKAIG
jgi:hypothetical protein